MTISTPADLDLLHFDSRSADASLKRVKRALAAGANSNATHQAGESALILALREEQPTVAIALIASGARVDARGACGSPAIVLAAKSKRSVNAVIALINAGARLDARDRWAASVGSLQSGEALLSAGADPSAQDNAGLTIFEWASAFGDMAKEDWSKLLTSHGKAAAEAHSESLGHIRLIDDVGREQLCRPDCFEPEFPDDRLPELGLLSIALNIPAMDPALLTLDQLALVPARLVIDSLLFSGNRFFLYAMRMASESTRQRLFASVYDGHDASLLDQTLSELSALDAEPPTEEHL